MVRREVGGCTMRCMVSSTTSETYFEVCECCGSSLESVLVGCWYGWVDVLGVGGGRGMGGCTERAT